MDSCYTVYYAGYSFLKFFVLLLLILLVFIPLSFIHLNPFLMMLKRLKNKWVKGKDEVSK